MVVVRGLAGQEVKISGLMENRYLRSQALAVCSAGGLFSANGIARAMSLVL